MLNAITSLGICIHAFYIQILREERLFPNHYTTRSSKVALKRSVYFAQ